MKSIYEPWNIGTMKLKNHTFMAPMSLGDESQDGCINEKMEAFWLTRAKNEVGCIIMDATSVDPKVPYLGNTLCFHDQSSIERLLQIRFTKQVVRSYLRLLTQDLKASVLSLVFHQWHQVYI